EVDRRGERMRKFFRGRTMLVVLLAALLAAGGCDLFMHRETTVSGVVVDAETGNPLEGIGVTLRIGTAASGYYPVVAADTTSGQGTFRLRYDTEGRSSYPIFEVNITPYNPSYSTFSDRVERGKSHVKRIELDPTAE